MTKFVSAGRSSGKGGGSAGALAVMDHSHRVRGQPECQFVAHAFGGASYDDDMLDDADGVVLRSTAVAQFTSSSESMTETIEFVAGYSLSDRDTTSPSQLVRKYNFLPIVEKFPLSTPESSNLMQRRSSKTESSAILDPEICNPLRCINSRANPRRVVSTAGRATPPLTAKMDVSQTDEQTILNRSQTLKKEQDADDRVSPFGPVRAQESQTYMYNATKLELDEMGQWRWDIQKKVFERYFALNQKERQWGALEIRDSRVIFHPGQRRIAVMTEKKFHDDVSRKEGDMAWYAHRRAQFAEEMREFTREETKHKQELMLTHLEKNSPFCQFPILGNRFIMTKLLGKGGNGEVWEVIDYANQRKRCALKLSVSHKHAQREQFTHSRLRHQHIVGVGDAVYMMEHRQQLYTGFTVECVETDLQQLIEISDHFDEAAALKVLFQLLNALTYLHDEMKIAHYDLKPTNILVSSDGCVKLTDFDLARNVHDPIVSSSVGTLRYLPPECFLPNFGDCYGTAEKADIWMVGVVFCMTLWGKHPILPVKSSPEDTRAMLAQYDGTLNFVRPISEMSRWMIQGCLHPDPRCRPSASQLLQALKNVAQQ